MKTCSRCKQSKPYDDFYPDRRRKDGHRCYCRGCTREMHQERVNRGLVKRGPRRPRTGAHSRDWRERRPGATRAHNVVAWALKTGKLVRPERCSRCERGGRIEAHHESYDRPLEVEWLCARCHSHVTQGVGV